MGSFYGPLPAHDALWDSSLETSSDLLARLACCLALCPWGMHVPFIILTFFLISWFWVFECYIFENVFEISITIESLSFQLKLAWMVLRCDRFVKNSELSGLELILFFGVISFHFAFPCNYQFGISAHDKQICRLSTFDVPGLLWPLS